MQMPVAVASLNLDSTCIIDMGNLPLAFQNCWIFMAARIFIAARIFMLVIGGIDSSISQSQQV